MESDSDASGENLDDAEFTVESDDDQSTGAEVVGFSGTGGYPCISLSLPSCKLIFRGTRHDE